MHEDTRWRAAARPCRPRLSLLVASLDLRRCSELLSLAIYGKELFINAQKKRGFAAPLSVFAIFQITASVLAPAPSHHRVAHSDARPRPRRDAGDGPICLSPRRNGGRPSGDSRRSIPNRDAVDGRGLQQWAPAAPRESPRLPAPTRPQEPDIKRAEMRAKSFSQ